MKSEAFLFPSGNTDYHFEASLHAHLPEIAPPASTIIVTDENVAKAHGAKWSDYRSIVIPAGEESKSLETIRDITKELIRYEAHRGTTLVGIGGGMITDITGFVASVYMRGVKVGFVPTTLLAMADAAIGGKNGVNMEVHKNMLGTIRQPSFILFDTGLLLTLPDKQWSNGFAEVIKYGLIADARILTTLQDADITFFQKHPQNLQELIEGCVDVKSKIVNADEAEGGLRKMLNFGHTAGHAIETLYGLPHGFAVGLGMRIAIHLSQQHAGLEADAGAMLDGLLAQYGLPSQQEYDEARLMEVIIMDKKRHDTHIDFVLISKPGVAITKALQPDEICAGLSVVQV